MSGGMAGGTTGDSATLPFDLRKLVFRARSLFANM
jgi:hypothetical protein